LTRNGCVVSQRILVWKNVRKLRNYPSKKTKNNGVLLPTTDLLGTAKTAGKHAASRHRDHENLILLFAQNLIKRRDTPHTSIYGTIFDVCFNNNIRIGVCIMCIPQSLIERNKNHCERSSIARVSRDVFVNEFVFISHF